MDQKTAENLVTAGKIIALIGTILVTVGTGGVGGIAFGAASAGAIGSIEAKPVK